MENNKTKIALALRYRPKKFSEVVEQNAVKQILASELKSGNLKRCLLFTGPAGCGKTTDARIFATEIEPVLTNTIEINCADHTGVEDVRSLVIEPSRIKPIVGQYKIFILDECHMLTTQSQNALLKILEEPPAFCVYILCTTDPQKVLGTILSRAFRYDFQLISHQGIVDRLNYILESEKNDPEGCGIQSWDMDALSMVATYAKGHMRDAITTIDKLISFTKNITVQDVENVLGVTSYELLFNVLDSIILKNENGLIQSLENVCKSGMDLKLFAKNFLAFVLDANKYIILKNNNVPDYMSFLNIPRSFENRLMNYNLSHKQSFNNLLKCLLELNSKLKWETTVKPVLETELLLGVM